MNTQAREMSKFWIFECLAQKVIIVEADTLEEAAEIADEEFTDMRGYEPIDMEGKSGAISKENAASEIRHGATNATDSIPRKGR